MRKTRVMVVDGEMNTRRLIVRAIEREPSMELVGLAPLGQVALDKISRLQPDLIVLGIAETQPDAMATLVQVRSMCQDLPIVVVSSNAKRGNPLTLEAITIGASGHVSIRTGDGEDATIEHLRKDLIALYDVLMPSSTHDSDAQGLKASGQLPREPSTTRMPIEAVVVAVSTGGPNALASIMPSFPADFPVPILIVQHMLENFSYALAERLDSLGPIQVREAFPGAEAVAGTAWLSPSGVHLEIRRERTGLRLAFNHGPEENFCRPAGDVLFRSAASALDGKVLGVVLTGMGYDGLQGCRAIRAVGGTVLVQDISTCVIEGGMPGHVADAGLAHKILPLHEIGAEIVRIVRTGRHNRNAT